MSLKLLNRGLAVIAQRKALLIFPSTKTEGTATTNGLHLFLFHLVQALFPLSRKKRTMENGRSCSANRNADSHKLEADEGAIIRIRHKSRAIIRGMFSARARVSTFFVLERMSLQLTILVLYSPPPSNFVPVSFFRRLLCFAPSDNYIQRSWTDERRTSFSPRSVGRSRSRSVPRWVCVCIETSNFEQT